MQIYETSSRGIDAKSDSLPFAPELSAKVFAGSGRQHRAKGVALFKSRLDSRSQSLLQHHSCAMQSDFHDGNTKVQNLGCLVGIEFLYIA